MLGRNFDQRHSRVTPCSVVHSVPDIPKPCTQARVVQFLDPRIRVRCRRCLSSDGCPILVRRVLECDLAQLVVLEVFELLAVIVGDEEEVGPGTLSNGHGSSDGADVGTKGAEETDLELVNGGIEFFDLLVLGRFVVVVVGNGGVGIGVELLLREWLRHCSSGGIDDGFDDVKDGWWFG